MRFLIWLVFLLIAVAWLSDLRAENLERMIQHANRHRLANNRQAVAPSPELTAVAQRYADFLYATGQQGHYANGTPWQRAARGGFTGTLLFNERLGNWYWTGASWKRVVHHDAGEVLCFGGQSIHDAFDGWMQSSGHRAAVLEPSFDVAGFGQRGTVWVGLFGNSKGTR